MLTMDSYEEKRLNVNSVKVLSPSPIRNSIIG